MIFHLRQKNADVAYYTLLLGIWKPEDEIFRKDYRFVRASTVIQEPEFANERGLFDGLARLTDKELRQTNRMRLPKEMSLQVKLAKVEQRKLQMIRYEKSLREELERAKTAGAQELRAMYEEPQVPVNETVLIQTCV